MRSLNFLLIILLNMLIYSTIICSEDELKQLKYAGGRKSFDHTCRDCSINDVDGKKTLRCICRKKDQSENTTSLDITNYDSDNNFISNEDGNLTSLSKYPRRWYPPSSFPPD